MYIYIHTYIQIDRQTDRHTYIQIDRQTDIHTYIHKKSMEIKAKDCWSQTTPQITSRAFFRRNRGFKRHAVGLAGSFQVGGTGRLRRNRGAAGPGTPELGRLPAWIHSRIM